MTAKAKTLSSVLSKYEELHKLYDKAVNAFRVETNKFNKLKSEMESFMLNEVENNNENVEVSEYLRQQEPYIAFKVSPQTDDSAILSYRIIREKIAESNRTAKDLAEAMNSEKDLIGAWILAQMNARKLSGITCAGNVGSAYKQKKIVASASDWDAFLRWVSQEGASDAVQKRVNSSFISKYFDEYGEYPPYLNVYQEYDIVVRKAPNV